MKAESVILNLSNRWSRQSRQAIVVVIFFFFLINFLVSIWFPENKIIMAKFTLFAIRWCYDITPYVFDTKICSRETKLTFLGWWYTYLYFTVRKLKVNRINFNDIWHWKIHFPCEKLVFWDMRPCKNSDQLIYPGSLIGAFLFLYGQPRIFTRPRGIKTGHDQFCLFLQLRPNYYCSYYYMYHEYLVVEHCYFKQSVKVPLRLYRW